MEPVLLAVLQTIQVYHSKAASACSPIEFLSALTHIRTVYKFKNVFIYQKRFIWFNLDFELNHDLYSQMYQTSHVG